MKLEHLTLTLVAAAPNGSVQFWLCRPQQAAVPLCCINPASGLWQSAACFPADADTPWFDDADGTALRSSLFLLGVVDIQAAVAALLQQAQQVAMVCTVRDEAA